MDKKKILNYPMNKFQSQQSKFIHRRETQQIDYIFSKLIMNLPKKQGCVGLHLQVPII